MREIKVERYENSQARFRDRLEKITQKKQNSGRRREKTSFIKYEQKGKLISTELGNC